MTGIMTMTVVILGSALGYFFIHTYYLKLITTTMRAFNPEGRADLTILIRIACGLVVFMLSALQPLALCELVLLPLAALINWRRTFPAVKELFYLENRSLTNYECV